MSDERATSAIDKEKSHMYEEIIMDENSIFKNHNKTDVYIMSATLGYYYKERKEIPSANRQELFVTTTLGTGGNDKLWIMKSIAISIDGLNALKSMKEVIKICDSYANAGIDRLYGIHKNSDDEASEIALIMVESLDDFVKTQPDDLKQTS